MSSSIFVRSAATVGRSTPETSPTEAPVGRPCTLPILRLPLGIAAWSQPELPAGQKAPHTLREPRLRRAFIPRIAGLLIAWLMTAGWAEAQFGPIIGDVNNDGVFDALDLGAAVDWLRHPTTRKLPAGDVAEPCDGVLGPRDGWRIFAGVAAQTGSNGPKHSIRSHCHDGNLGDPLHTDRTPPPLVTLDDQFAHIARRVPEFGGLFVHDGAVQVVLTQLDDNVLHRARLAIAKEFGKHRFDGLDFRAHPGRYTFLQLLAWRDHVIPFLEGGLVTSVDADEARNVLTVGVADEKARRTVDKTLRNRGVPKGAVRFVQRPPLRPLDLASELQSHQRPLVGGLVIETEDAACTGGFLAKWFGSAPVLLTNSHCLSPLGQNAGLAVFQDDLSAWPSDTLDQIGVEALDPPLGCSWGVPCRLSDSVMIALDDDVTGRLGLVAGLPGPYDQFGHYEVVGKGQAFCGETVIGIGMMSGERHVEVTGTCVGLLANSSAVPGSPLVTSFTCQTEVETGTATSGDSGGPILRSINGSREVELLGLNVGSFVGTSVFSPISNIESEIGVLDPVARNEPPSVWITSPFDGEHLGSGAFVPAHLEAQVRDFEEGNECLDCSVDWTSVKAGGMLGSSDWESGTSALDTILGAGSGFYAITATAYDDLGQSSWDTVVAKVGESAPSVWIDNPSDGAGLTPQTPYQFAGSSFDTDLFMALPCGNLTWTSSRSGDSDFPVTGCFPVVSFPTLGARDITLTGVDGTNQSSQTTISVDVVEPSGTSHIVVTFISPGPGSLTPADQLTTVTATATQYGGNSDPFQMQFRLQYGTTIVPLQTEWIAPGQPSSVTFRAADHIPASCGSTSYTIIASARRGLFTTSVVLDLEAGFPPC